MTSPRPPWWQDPNPPTDPSGFAPPTRVDQRTHRVRWGWVLGALFVVLAVLLALVLSQLRHPTLSPDSPGTATEPAGPTPTLPLLVNGYRYSIGISAFTPAVEAPGGQSAPPGRHFLVASLVLRNDQSDRSAPALLDSFGTAPAIEVGITPLAFLPPLHALNTVVDVSDCDNDPRNYRSYATPLYRGLPAQTCIVRSQAYPAVLAASGVDDTTMAPGAVTVGIVRTIDLPDDVTTPQVSAWITTASSPSPQGPSVVLDRIAPTS